MAFHPESNAVQQKSRRCQIRHKSAHFGLRLRGKKKRPTAKRERLGAGPRSAGVPFRGVGPAGVTKIGRPVSNVSKKAWQTRVVPEKQIDARYTTIESLGRENAHRERSSARDRKARRERQVRREWSDKVGEPSQAGAIATQMTHITKAVPTSVSIIVEVLSPGRIAGRPPKGPPNFSGPR